MTTGSDFHQSTGIGTFLIPPGENEREERMALLAHLRGAHPNLFGYGGPASAMFASPLPSDGAEELPLQFLVAVHRASHAGLPRDHHLDDWLVGTERES